ncbi:PREDICTED: uncharacterized protein LOC104599189 [Nelumbo nucifera]|uniref:Uncharacterized protein LOC104599189 n=2 Tax=Nelumbo nucifera TaxID=4432 RepID=A0A1U7ZZC4_NELNU|nr:PREDICTED: uncharacterized protein LOC104599189 [Nelumbo nucifera]DAD27747.1 TPA_asm: hypothetical protein HUJ06_029215 [Nelumbo nucifera]
MAENKDLQDFEAEEALSLCDLPITDGTEWEEFFNDDRRPSPDQELFEFFSDWSAQMCPAEDVIFCGKLIPRRQKESLSDSDQCRDGKSVRDEIYGREFSCRRSGSLREQGMESSYSSLKGKLMKSSHPQDYRKLQKVQSSKTSSAKGNEQRSSSVRRASVSSPPAKPRWQLFLFGLKFPREMNLKDIKNRQNRSRRIPTSMFSAFDGGETISVKREDEKGAWRFIRALSCRGHANAAVTASLSCIPHV